MAPPAAAAADCPAWASDEAPWPWSFPAANEPELPAVLPDTTCLPLLWSALMTAMALRVTTIMAETPRAVALRRMTWIPSDIAPLS